VSSVSLGLAWILDSSSHHFFFFARNIIIKVRQQRRLALGFMGEMERMGFSRVWVGSAVTVTSATFSFNVLFCFSHDTCSLTRTAFFSVSCSLDLGGLDFLLFFCYRWRGFRGRMHACVLLPVLSKHCTSIDPSFLYSSRWACQLANFVCVGVRCVCSFKSLFLRRRNGGGGVYP
jgi:hypothetical protein